MLLDRCQPCAKSELTFFDPNLIQNSVTGSRFVEINPMTTITPNGPIEFEIPSGGPNSYLDLEATTLYIRLDKVTNKGVAINPVDNKIAYVNNIMNSLFSEVSFKIENRIIEYNGNMFGYKAMLYNLLNYGMDIRKEVLYEQGFIIDDAGKMEANDNAGAVDRAILAAKDNQLFVGTISLDFFRQTKYLMAGFNCYLTFNYQKPTFCMFNAASAADDDYKFIIKDARLLVRRVEVAPSVVNGHIEELKHNNILIQYLRIFDMIFKPKSFQEEFTVLIW